MNIVLANHDYHRHMTDEGLQLQNGLQSAGWTMTGPGYDNYQDVGAILSSYTPSAVFVQDKRDWDPNSGVCYGGKGLEYKHIQLLADLPGMVAVPVKDAGPDGSDYHEAFCREVRAKAVVLYYHPLSCLKFCPWLSDYKLIRTHHTVDLDVIPRFVPADKRWNVLGSGAVIEDIYPLRYRVSFRAKEFGLVWLRHPGYGNQGSHTPRYLEILSHFKVHLATASAYGFSLRKIIESVACGCTPITDLPEYDVLPHIDRALVRISPTISDQDLKVVIRQALQDWDEDGRRSWARKAQSYYNYRSEGERLSRALLA